MVTGQCQENSCTVLCWACNNTAKLTRCLLLAAAAATSVLLIQAVQIRDKSIEIYDFCMSPFSYHWIGVGLQSAKSTNAARKLLGIGKLTKAIHIIFLCTHLSLFGFCCDAPQHFG